MRLVSYASYTSVVMFILFDIIALSSPLCCCHVYIFCIYVVSSWALLPTGFLNKILYCIVFENKYSFLLCLFHLKMGLLTAFAFHSSPSPRLCAV